MLTELLLQMFVSLVACRVVSLLFMDCWEGMTSCVQVTLLNLALFTLAQFAPSISSISAQH